MKVLVINGPNLNLLGAREPALYGHATWEQVAAGLERFAAGLGVELLFFQSNSEGALIDAVQGARLPLAGVVINPGGLTHTSVALLDALLACPLPVIEVHLTNLARREEFRSHSLTARGALGRIEGFGPMGYQLALSALLQLADGGDNGVQRGNGG